jgi:hypothetical protein
LRTWDRAAWVCSAWPWWTVAGVISPIPEWRCWWFYADVRVMPMWGRDRSVGGVIAGSGSA